MPLTICLTHDIDRVRKTYHYITHDLRRGQFANLATLLNGTRPYWQFDTIMQLEDQAGARSTFFFLEESIRPGLRPSSWPLAFGRYRFSERRVSEMIRTLDGDGWEVALHGSFDSYRRPELLRTEKARLEQQLRKPVQGIRQHHLNLDIPDTWLHQRAAGLQYDATFGKRKGGIGYRDEQRRPFVDPVSGMFVIPLALMEIYLFKLAHHDAEAAWRLTLALMDEAEMHDAVLTVLWHNQVFYEDEFPGYMEVYRRILEEGVRRSADFLTCREVWQRYNGEVAAYRPVSVSV